MNRSSLQLLPKMFHCDHNHGFYSTGKERHNLALATCLELSYRTYWLETMGFHTLGVLFPPITDSVKLVNIPSIYSINIYKHLFNKLKSRLFFLNLKQLDSITTLYLLPQSALIIIQAEAYKSIGWSSFSVCFFLGKVSTREGLDELHSLNIGVEMFSLNKGSFVACPSISRSTHLKKYNKHFHKVH